VSDALLVGCGGFAMTSLWARLAGRSNRQREAVEVVHPIADVLVVCTANICRSPMGEAFLRSALSELGSELSVTSAGFLEDGRRVDALSAQAASRFGADIGGHRSTRMSLEQLENAKVILCMTTEHRRRVAGIRTSLYAKTFTLQEFVNRSLDLAPELRSKDLASWIPALHGDRTGRELLSDDERICVADPYGEAISAHTATAQRLFDLSREIAEILR
jgi:protein-tyrosine phosphatase